MRMRLCKQRRVSFILVWGNRSPAGGICVLFLGVSLCDGWKRGSAGVVLCVCVCVCLFACERK